MKKSAIKNLDGKYRYLLTREWDDTKPVLGFILMNPSVADDEITDPTVTRLIKRAMNLGYGGLRIANLCAYITPYSDELNGIENPFGEENEYYIKEIIRDSEVVIVGWGNIGHKYYSHYQEMLSDKDLYCLGINKSGAPKHPLYVAYNTELKLYK